MFKDLNFVDFTYLITESMIMTKTHKEIAVQLVQLAAREDMTEIQIVKEVTNRTSDLLHNLR